MKICLPILIIFALIYQSISEALAPLFEAERGYPIKDQYIVVFKSTQLGIQTVQEIHKSWILSKISSSPQSKLVHYYNTIPAYAVRVELGLLNEIRERPEVQYVEKDSVVHVWGSFLKFSKTGKNKVKNEDRVWNKVDALIQVNAPWGLSRISKYRKRSMYTGETYVYPKAAGSGVDVYVIDTGINVSHSEFDGRARWGTTIPYGDSSIDTNGHGTHCAGIIAGKTFGVAKQASVIAVKVLRSNGFGSNSDVIKGVEWVALQHQNAKDKGRKSIASMSLGGSRSFALELMVKKAIQMGVSFAIAAGNDFEDACNYSPASVQEAITVGAIDSTDTMAYFSNYGRCVDLFAPGVNIISSWKGSSSATKILSGTSMAAPHVAGVMALYLAKYDMTPEELKNTLLKDGLVDMLRGIPMNTVNNLLCTMSLVKRQ